MAGPFDDLIPQQGQAPAAANPFADLIPGQGGDARAPYGVGGLVAQGVGLTPPAAHSYSAMEAFNAGALHGVPILGPLVEGGMDRAAAGVRSLWKGTPYADELKAVQDQVAGIDQGMHDQHPIASKVGEVVGGVVGTAPAIAYAPERFGASAAAPIMSRMVSGALSGGAIGGVDAAVRTGGDVPESTKGAVTGATLGFLAPGASKAIGAGVGMVADAVASRSNTALAPLSRAARNYATEQFADPAKAGAMRDRLAQLGPEAMPADVSPEWMMVARGAAARPGQRDMIVNTLMDRDGGKNARLGYDLDVALGRPVVPSQVDASIAERQGQLGPDYRRVLGEAAPVDLRMLAGNLDDSGEVLRGDPLRANQRAREMLTAPGTNPPQLETRPQAVMATRQALDDMINANSPPAPNTMRVLTDARASVDGALADAAPGLKPLDAQFEQLAQQRDGLARGQAIFGNGKMAVRPAELQDEVQQAAQPNGMLTGPSAAPFRMQQGARAEIDRIAGTSANDPAAIQSMVKGDGDWNRQKLGILFGPERADQALDAIDRETTFYRTKNRVENGSDTSAGEGFREHLNKLATPMELPPAMTIMGAIGAAAKKGVNAVTRGSAERSAQRFAGELGEFAVSRGDARDALVDALMRRAARQSTASQLTPGQQAMVRALMQGSGVAASN